MPARSIARRLAVALTALALIATAGRAAEPELSFAAIGDWGKGTVQQKEVAAALGHAVEAIHARFIVSTGDHFYPRGVKSPDDPKWKTLFEDIYTAPSLMIPWRVALGNHDHRGSATAQISYSESNPRWRLPARYYKHSERFGDGMEADFFFLDTTPLYQASRWPWKLWPFENEQYAWLERELAASTASWKIVIGHHPVFSGGSHGGTPVLIEKLRPLLQRYGVNAYICGHNHTLEHIAVDGVHYFSVGAGAEGSAARPIVGSHATFDGAGLMTAIVLADRMLVEFIDKIGTTLYRTEVHRRSP